MQADVKFLKANRRDLLRDYLLACVRDNVLTPADLASGAVIEKVLSAVAADVKSVTAALVKNTAGNAAAMLAGWIAAKATKR